MLGTCFEVLQCLHLERLTSTGLSCKIKSLFVVQLIGSVPLPLHNHLTISNVHDFITLFPDCLFYLSMFVYNDFDLVPDDYCHGVIHV